MSPTATVVGAEVAWDAFSWRVFTSNRCAKCKKISLSYKTKKKRWVESVPLQSRTSSLVFMRQHFLQKSNSHFAPLGLGHWAQRSSTRLVAKRGIISSTMLPMQSFLFGSLLSILFSWRLEICLGTGTGSASSTSSFPSPLWAFFELNLVGGGR